MNTKAIFMLTNSQSMLPNGEPVMLYAGLGYVLETNEADGFLDNGLAVEINEVDNGSPKTNHGTIRVPSDGHGSKRLPKSGRGTRRRKNTSNDKGRNSKS